MTSATPQASPQELDLALHPPSATQPRVLTTPGAAYASHTRQWQGIPGIERAANGRLWAVWYTGGDGEGPGNYVVLISSADDGRTWSAPQTVIDPGAPLRAYDPCLWHDPNGRMWLFWAQSYGFFDGRAGVWAICCQDSGSAQPAWSQPRRLANGVMMNKPTVTRSGIWLLPAAVWACMQPHRPELSAERYSNVVASVDGGETWARRGGADVPERQFDEQMLVERADGSLWMLVRTAYGIGESCSTDGGFTWSPGRPTTLGGPGARFFIRRLRSGRLLLVNHHHSSGRNNLTALLSEDDGATWRGGLLLDGRADVSYPDGVETEDGRIYVIYDRERTCAREILVAVFSEDDVLRGEWGVGSRRQVLVDRAGTTV